MTREVIGRWPLVVEVEIDEEEFRFAVEMQDLGAIPRGDFDRVRGGIRFCSQAHPNLSGVHSVAHTVYVLGSEVLADDEWSVNTWPASRLPEFRAAVEQLVEELRDHKAPLPPNRGCEPRRRPPRVRPTRGAAARAGGGVVSGLVKHGGLRGYPCASHQSPGRCAWCGGWLEGVKLCGVRNAQAAEDLRNTIGDICGYVLRAEAREE